jgi:SulP family sulfate permease
MAAASAAVWLLLLLLLLAPLARHLPLAVVGALLLVVALGLFDWREMRRLWHEAPADRVPLVVTLVATVTLSLEWAILLGVTSALLAQQWAARRG